MYINWETIITAGKIIGALGAIISAVVALYKTVESIKLQKKDICSIKEEQTLLCYGILACLKGLKEQGCNGPVTHALDKLEKHLNEEAHDQHNNAHGA